MFFTTRALLLTAAAALLLAPATRAQDHELVVGDLPALRFNVGVMQSAQYLQTDDDTFAGDAAPGFHRVRFNLTLGMDVHERINAVVDLGHEPNDFGDEFAPAVDYVAVNLLLTDRLTLQFGTPVTGLFHFRGYSDGAAVQGNPLIGNSPADFVTAETGVQLRGAFGDVDVDLTVTSPTFFETFTPGTGLTLVARAATRLTEQVGVGASVAQATNGGTADRYFDGELAFAQVDAMNLIAGDGENYALPPLGQPNRYTHAYLLPGIEATLLQVDAVLEADPLTVDAWGGYGLEGYSFADAAGRPVPARAGVRFVEEDSRMWWAGATVRAAVTEQAYLAARGTVVTNASDWADDETMLYRVQAGGGLRFWDAALVKVEYVYQAEQANSPGQLGVDWQGVLLELSVVF